MGRSRRGLKWIGGGLLGLWALGVLWPGTARGQFIVHDPAHMAMNEAQWVRQLQDMAAQIRRLEEQIELYKKKIKQWDEDFKTIWGQPSGRHGVLHTDTQTLYTRLNPWFDQLRTAEAVYNDLNQITRDPRAAFDQIRQARDGFTTIRATLDRDRRWPAALKDYYRALGNLSSEGLYVAARSTGAGPTLWSDASALSDYARDTSPAGAAKTAAFAAGAQLYAQGYQLETQNRMLRQLAYLNMRQENDQRMALQVAAGMQTGLAETLRALPLRAHGID